MGSNVPVRNESMMKWYMKWIIYGSYIVYQTLICHLDLQISQLHNHTYLKTQKQGYMLCHVLEHSKNVYTSFKSTIEVACL